MTMRSSEGRKLRKVPGQPGVLEVMDTFRPVKNAPGPMIQDQGPWGESPPMNEPMPYMSHAEHMRILSGGDSTEKQPGKRRRDSAD